MIGGITIVAVVDVWPGCVLRWLVVVVWIVCSKRLQPFRMNGSGTSYDTVAECRECREKKLEYEFLGSKTRVLRDVMFVL